MRIILLKAACLAVMGFCAVLCAPAQTSKTRLQLVDSITGKPRAGIIRVVASDIDKPLALPGLFDRLRGLDQSAAVSGWYVVPLGGAETVLPRKRLRLEALSGLETALARRDIDLTSSAPHEVVMQLTPLFEPGKLGLAAGNTHLHLRGLSQGDSDEYLRQIPAADGLQVLFISYLERHKDDVDYITNRYPIGELKQLGTTGVLYGNGEEHRHNFDAYEQGYGHVMFLGIKDLVRPVSLGAGITGAGFDDLPLRTGIDAAHRQGGTVIWCHNSSGYEGVPTALAGLLDALNIFDGSRTGKFEDNYYRYLNIGSRLPISTGTDWFLYDFSRVYAKAPGPLTLESWLKAVKAGRATVTNGPLLTLQVDGLEIGDTVKLEQGRTVRVVGTAVGRHDFGQLQVVQNGNVVFAQQAKKQGDHYETKVDSDIRISTPGWLALRIESADRNELGCKLYAHTSPVYIDIAGRRSFDIEAALALLRQVEEGAARIRARGRFSSTEASDNLLGLYDEAARDLKQRLSQRGK